MSAEQFAGDLVREKLRRLIDRQTILTAVVEPHASTCVSRALSDGLAITPPPRHLIDGSVMREAEKIVAGEREKRISIQDARFGLVERVGAKTVLVDFEDQFAVATESPERPGWQARVHSVS